MLLSVFFRCRRNSIIRLVSNPLRLRSAGRVITTLTTTPITGRSIHSWTQLCARGDVILSAVFERQWDSSPQDIDITSRVGGFTFALRSLTCDDMLPLSQPWLDPLTTSVRTLSTLHASGKNWRLLASTILDGAEHGVHLCYSRRTATIMGLIQLQLLGFMLAGNPLQYMFIINARGDRKVFN